MSSYSKLCERISQGLNIFLIMILALLVLDVCWQVLTRFVFQQPSSFTDEAARFLLIWLSLFGAAAAYRQGMHLGIDVFVKRQSESAQQWLGAIANFFVLVFALTILVYGGSKLVQLTSNLDQVSAVLGIKMAYIYAALPVSGLLFSLFALDFILHPERGLRLNMDAEQEAGGQS